MAVNFKEHEMSKQFGYVIKANSEDGAHYAIVRERRIVAWSACEEDATIFATTGEPERIAAAYVSEGDGWIFNVRVTSATKLQGA